MVGAVALGDSRETKKVTSADAISVSQVDISKPCSCSCFMVSYSRCGVHSSILDIVAA